ncbi:hypothetical protein DMUE_4127 [Dictyocoela muelleri]|nr:hypothetical protein DMUE_4127 [Dictyocoela muelleri]
MKLSAYNPLSFEFFLIELFDILRAINVENAVFVMDNVSFHKSSLITNLVEYTQHSILYLPPYSPFLNPIENLFSQWKDLVRRSNCNSESELFDRISGSLNEIGSVQCQNYYLHMLKFLPRCSNKEIILDCL